MGPKLIKFNVYKVWTRKKKVNSRWWYQQATVLNYHLENSSLQMGRILKHPIFNILNFRGWIKRIFSTVDKCNFCPVLLDRTKHFVRGQNILSDGQNILSRDKTFFLTDKLFFPLDKTICPKEKTFCPRTKCFVLFRRTGHETSDWTC